MRATTLLYHDVVPDSRWSLSGFEGADADVYKMDCTDFRRHLEAVRAHLRGQMTTSTALLATRPSSPVMITFDDGGVSAATHIAGMLEEFGWRGHFLVTGARIGTRGFVDAAQIRELDQRGHIVGSHSWSHPTRMALCSRAQLDDEWSRSVHCLSDILGKPVTVASVPGGFYSREVAASASAAGIRLLFNSEPVTSLYRVEECLVVGRYSAQRAHPPQWAADIVSGNSGLAAREYLFWNVKKVAKLVLGGAWLKARKALLERRSATVK